MDVDVLIIGAGVVGLAVAARVANAGRTVFVVDKAGSYGQGISSRNSEVVHSGIYYPPGSLKARLCVAGNARLQALSRDERIKLQPLGKIVVACDEEERSDLQRLLKVGLANGVEGLRLLDKSDLNRLEPNVRAIAGLHVPSTAILDAYSLMRYLVYRAQAGGASFVFGAEIVGAQLEGDGYTLVLSYGSGASDAVTTRTVINAAGVHSDTVAALPGLDVDAIGYRLEWVKGNYAEVVNGKSGMISRLVYPVPVHHGVSAAAGKAAFAGLGVHATLGIDGRMRLGPDVEYLDERREDYSTNGEAAERLRQSACRYLPFLEPGDVVPESGSLRPRLAAARQGFADFVISDEASRGLPGWVNLIGIESPGLTSSLAIADEVGKTLSVYL